MKRSFFLNLIFILSAFSIFAQDRQLVRDNPIEEQRVALVIGNAAYENSPLKNPVNDARAIAQTLQALGFQVILKENINQVEMKRAVREFGDKIKNGGVGLFYFAGHGVQVKGQNYLVPIGATITKEEEVEYEGVDVGFVMAQMEAAKNRMNLVILDACRNNPFARSYRSESSGLASINAPSGTLIAYATAPGSVASDGNGANGLYTQELLYNMRTIGLNIEEVFKRVRIAVREKTQNKQTPWESSSLTGDFFFVKSGDVKPNTANQQIQVPVVDSTAVELAYWNSIKDSKDAEDYKAYLAKYPNGQFEDIAKRRLEAIDNESLKSKELEYTRSLNSLKQFEATDEVIKKWGWSAKHQTTSLEPCQIKIETSISQDKDSFVVYITFNLSDINLTSIQPDRIETSDKQPLWQIKLSAIAGRSFNSGLTIYKDRELTKVKTPLVTSKSSSAYFRFFTDLEKANQYVEEFKNIAKLCGAKSE